VRLHSELYQYRRASLSDRRQYFGFSSAIFKDFVAIYARLNPISDNFGHLNCAFLREYVKVVKRSFSL
jgi:hypothetical protein